MTDWLPTKKVCQKMRPVGEKWTRIPSNHIERQVAIYRDICHIEGPGFEKKLALTFDDGPSHLTETLLNLLKKLDVQATFFWLGRKLKEFDFLARRAQAEGHTFGNHSFDHTSFTKISTEKVLRGQIRRTQLVFHDILGIEPALVRPPFGEVTDDQIDALNSIGMKIVFWSIDAGDSLAGNNDEDRITNRVVNNVHEEAIVLMHDGNSICCNIVTVVRSVVDICRTRGYEFVTVHDLIGIEESL